MLLKINNSISEFDSSKVIGLRTLQLQLKEINNIPGRKILNFKPTQSELISKYGNNNEIQYPHFNKLKKVTYFKFLKYDTPISFYKFLNIDQKNTINDAFLILKRFTGQPNWEWLEKITDSKDNSLNLNFFPQY